MVLLGWTLRETRSAAKSARDTLDVAQNTLTQAQQHSIRELSPVITTSDLSFSFKEGGEDAYGNPLGVAVSCGQIEGTVKVKIKNWGNTPIYKLSITGDVWYSELAKTERKPTKEDLNHEGHVVGVIGILAPSEEREIELSIRINTTNILYDDMPDTYVSIDDMYIILDGEIVFTDVFTIDNHLDETRLFTFWFSDWIEGTGHTLMTYPEEIDR